MRRLIPLLLLASLPAFAQDFGGGSGDTLTVPMHLELWGTGGYTSGRGQSSSPTLIQVGGGTTVAARYSIFLVGAVLDYRNEGQYSAIDPNVGNMTGTRLMLSPTVGVRLADWVGRVEYEFTGDYVLSNSTTAGGNIRYTAPIGVRATLLRRMASHLFAGVSYEFVSFSTISDSSQGVATLGSPLLLWHAAAVGAIVF
jgi:hypothetical protein